MNLDQDPNANIMKSPELQEAMDLRGRISDIMGQVKQGNPAVYEMLGGEESQDLLDGALSSRTDDVSLIAQYSEAWKSGLAVLEEIKTMHSSKAPEDALRKKGEEFQSSMGFDTFLYIAPSGVLFQRRKK